MKFQSFTIENFKGIKSCTIDVSQSSPRVYALIGLNESGKTTILEAINYFVAADTSLQKIYNLEYNTVNKADFVPKSRKSNFNGKISISAKILVEDEDISAVEAEFAKRGYNLDKSIISKSISVVQSFEYENSNYVRAQRQWDIAFYARKGKERKSKPVGAEHPCWNAYYATLHNRMPQICYFPTFLFELPDKIYLEKFDGEKPVNSYYLQLFQDILDSLDDGLDIKTHIVDRIRSKTTDWSWFSFLQTDKREQVNHVLLRASTKTTQVILESWRRVFNRSFDSKRIEIEFGHDASVDAVYIKIFLVDGSEKYDIVNRSLGFRWFFCFWLFTHFRSLRSNAFGVVFLLDEPASNLHARAQEELLNNLHTLSSDKNTVIYSTHSHYLVNPKWLDGAYIVSNGALNYNGIEDEFLSSGETNINATVYRQFIAKHPTQRTYFLPILDALDYKPSELTIERPGLIVEGKADFLFFKLAFASKAELFSIIPGSGAKSFNPLIGMMTGWGFPFVVLLDDDKEGRDAHNMYCNNWNIEGDSIKTLKDFSENAAGLSLESLILKECHQQLCDFYSITKPEKNHIQNWLAVNLAASTNIDFGQLLNKIAQEVKIWAERSLLPMIR